MANFLHATPLNPGDKFTVDGGTAAPAPSDTLVLNGVKLSVTEWVRRGRIRPVSTAAFVTTYHVLSCPQEEGTQAGG